MHEIFLCFLLITGSMLTYAWVFKENYIRASQKRLKVVMGVSYIWIAIMLIFVGNSMTKL